MFLYSSIGWRLPTNFASSRGIGKVPIFSTPIDNAKNSVVEKVDEKLRAIDRKSGFVNGLGKRGIKHMVERVREMEEWGNVGNLLGRCEGVFPSIFSSIFYKVIVFFYRLGNNRKCKPD